MEEKEKDKAVEAAAAKAAEASVPLPEPKRVTCPKCGHAYPEGQRTEVPGWVKIAPNGVEAKILCPDEANAAQVGLVRGSIMRTIGKMNRKADGYKRRVRILTEQIEDADAESLDELLAEREKLGEEAVGLQHEVLGLLLGDGLLRGHEGQPCWTFQAREDIRTEDGDAVIVKAGGVLPHPGDYRYQPGTQVQIIMEIEELYLERIENGIMFLGDYPVFSAGR